MSLRAGRVAVVDHQERCDCGAFLGRQVALPRPEGSVQWGGLELAYRCKMDATGRGVVIASACR